MLREMSDLFGCHRAVRGLQNHPWVYSVFVTSRLIDWFSSAQAIALNRSSLSSLSLCVLTPKPLPSPFTNAFVCIRVSVESPRLYLCARAAN